MGSRTARLTPPRPAHRLSRLSAQSGSTCFSARGLSTRAELYDAEVDEFDIDGVLGLAEHLVRHSGRPWVEGDLDEGQRLQEPLFPEGLAIPPTTGPRGSLPMLRELRRWCMNRDGR